MGNQCLMSPLLIYREEFLKNRGFSKVFEIFSYIF